eukprot:4125474-Prymnesium_polylepis.1
MPLVSSPNGTTVTSLAARMDSASSPRVRSAPITTGVRSSRSMPTSIVSPPCSTQKSSCRAL